MTHEYVLSREPRPRGHGRGRSARGLGVALSIGCAALAIGSSCATKRHADHASKMWQLAADPALRAVTCSLVAKDPNPVWREFAEAYRSDPHVDVRVHCYVWLILFGGEDAGRWLAEGLRDPESRVRATCAVYAREVPHFSADTWSALRHVLRSTVQGHVYEHAAHAAVLRGGEAVAEEIYDLTRERGTGWLECSALALSLFPRESFRPSFEAARDSDYEDRVRIGQRALCVLDGGSQEAAAAIGRTKAEFHAHWRPPYGQWIEPTLVTREQALLELRRCRVIVLGELHSDLASRATQILLLDDLLQAHGDVVLVGERGVVEYQEPLFAAARQRDVAVLFLETETEAHTLGPADRDELARTQLAAAVQRSPETVFLVCYGENHRRSLHAAVREVGVASASVCLYPRGAMLNTLLARTGGKVAGHALRWPDDSYFMPSSTPGSMLGCQALDEALDRLAR